MCHTDETTTRGLKRPFISETQCPPLSNLAFLSLSLCSRVVQLEGGRGGLHTTGSEGNKEDCWKSTEHFNKNDYFYLYKNRNVCKLWNS